MGISRDKAHKRRLTGGRVKRIRSKRKFEMGRQPANTKLGEKRVRRIRVRGGNFKFRALRLDHGNFSWPGEAITRKTRILKVVYNATSNELVRTNTLVKGCIVQIDATPFKIWYQKYYNITLGKAKEGEAEKLLAAEKKSKMTIKQYKRWRKALKAAKKQEEAAKSNTTPSNAGVKKPSSKPSKTATEVAKKVAAAKDTKKTAPQKKAEEKKPAQKKGAEKKAEEKKPAPKKGAEKKADEKKAEAAKQPAQKKGAKGQKKEEKPATDASKPEAEKTEAKGKKEKGEKKESKKQKAKKLTSEERRQAKFALRNKNRVLEAALAEQFKTGRLYARLTSRPGQCGRADGVILEGEELAFYLKKINLKKRK